MPRAQARDLLLFAQRNPEPCPVLEVLDAGAGGIGDPRELGIADLDAPDHGDAVRPEPGDAPVFRACGVTPQAVVVEPRPPLAIAHAPGHMPITGARDDDYRI